MNINGTTRSSRVNALPTDLEIGPDREIARTTPEASFRNAYDNAARAQSETMPVRSSGTPGPEPLALSEADASALAVFSEANRRTESGGVASFSMLCTTAGPEHRASFGVAQLTVREHLARMARLDDAALGQTGTTRAELDQMRARGDAAIAYYHLLVDGASLETSRETLQLSRADTARAQTLASAGDVPGLTELLGRSFSAATGLPASALRELASTRALRSGVLREDFRAQYEHDHGRAFDPGERDPARMIVSARHVALSHPELDSTVTALGPGDAGALALGHYLGVGDAAENMLGWHARAASTVPGTERFGAMLAAADPMSSRARESDDFSRALAATAAIGDLRGDERIAMLARVGRIFHGAPARARERFFVNGSLEAPRFTSRAELESAVAEMRAGRTWSDARLLGHVADVLAERRS